MSLDSATHSITTSGLDQNEAGCVASVDVAAYPAATPLGSLSSAPLDDRAFVATTTAAYGPTIRHLGSGKTELNLATMSRLLARRLRLVWDTTGREFLQLRADQTYVAVEPENVIRLLAESLERIAALHPDIFPIKELRPARVKKLMDTIQMAVPWKRPDVREALSRFVRENVQLKPGGAVTVTAFFEAYLRFARRHALSVYPRQAFSRELARVMLKDLQKTSSHSVIDVTKGRNNRGYKGVMLAEELCASGVVRDVGDSKIPIAMTANPS